MSYVNIFRCGYCGKPLNEDDEPLIEFDKSLDWENAEQSHGNCCKYHQEQHPHEVVTEEMAMDAGDNSLIGWRL